MNPPRLPSSASGRLGLALYLGVAVGPVLFALGYALLYSVGAVGWLSGGLTLEAWRRVFSEGEALASFGLSFAVAGVTTALVLAGSLTLALALRERLAGDGARGGWVASALYAPLALPAVVGAFLTFQLLTPSGILARWGAALGLFETPADVPALVNDAWAVGIVVAHVGLALPYFTLLFAELYRSANVEALAQVARSLGASPRAAR